MKQILWDVILRTDEAQSHARRCHSHRKQAASSQSCHRRTVHGFRRDFSSFSCNINPSEWRCVHVNEELFDGLISPVQIKKHSSSNESLEAAPEFQTLHDDKHTAFVYPVLSHILTSQSQFLFISFPFPASPLPLFQLQCFQAHKLSTDVIYDKSLHREARKPSLAAKNKQKKMAIDYFSVETQSNNYGRCDRGILINRCSSLFHHNTKNFSWNTLYRNI